MARTPKAAETAPQDSVQEAEIPTKDVVTPAASAPADGLSDRTRRKVREGVVVSDKMDKTVVITTSELKPHPLYKKVVQHRRRYKAHDEANACGVGDRVRIVETRPLSKDKRWRVAEILEKAK